MREVLKEIARVTKENVYVCDYCQKEFDWPQSCEEHELQEHNCGHVISFKLNLKEAESEYGNTEYSNGIVSYCKKCGKEFEEFVLERIEQDQEMLEYVFSLLKQGGKKK